MMTSIVDFCENCNKTLCNSVMSLFRDKIATNDRPMVVLLNSVGTAGMSWYVLHFTLRTLLSSLLLRKVYSVQFKARQLLLARTFSCVAL